MGKWKVRLLGLAGVVITLSKPALWLIDRLAEADFVNAHFGEFGQFLETGWGTLATVIGGMSLIAWALYLGLKERRPAHLVHRGEPIPDWPIRDLFFHVRSDFLEISNQDEFDAVFDEIVDKFSIDQLKCWGREIAGSHRLPLATIDPKNWQHLKLISWLVDDEASGGQVLQADRRKTSSPVPQYTGLQVNRAQALTIWPEKSGVRVAR